MLELMNPQALQKDCMEIQQLKQMRRQSQSGMQGLMGQ